MASPAVKLISADDYARIADDGTRTELVRGRIVTMTVPGFRHGEVCSRIAYLVQRYLDEHPIGRVVTNDSGILTERDPDTVRGADVSFYSYDRLPKDQRPVLYASASPEVVFEVKSPNDRWSRTLKKVGEYLDVDVQVVCVIDFEEEVVHLFREDESQVMLKKDAVLEIPDILPQWKIPVSRFFD